MAEIILKATVSEERRLVIDLPPDAPVGEVEVVIRTPQYRQREITREEARARLLAAGALSTAHRAPEGARALSVEERMRLGKMPPGARPSEELINEDRGEY